MQTNPERNSEVITFTPASGDVSLDWGDFRRVSDLLLGSFGIYISNGITAGVNIPIGSINVSTPNYATPASNSYGDSDFLGSFLLINGQLTLIPSVTKAEPIRACGTIVGKIN